MKYLKLIVMAVVIAFTFGSFDSAKAQVVVRASVGTGPYYWHGHHYNHRRAYWRHHHRYYRYY